MITHHLNVKVPMVATLSNIEISFVEGRELALCQNLPSYPVSAIRSAIRSAGLPFDTQRALKAWIWKMTRIIAVPMGGRAGDKRSEVRQEVGRGWDDELRPATLLQAS